MTSLLDSLRSALLIPIKSLMQSLHAGDLDIDLGEIVANEGALAKCILGKQIRATGMHYNCLGNLSEVFLTT